MTDFDEVLAAARSGEGWACARIYEDLRRPVAAYLRFRGATELDDVVSDTFLCVFRDLGRFVGDEQRFRAWVFTIARHRLADAWRAAARRPAEAADDVPEVVGGDAEAEAMAVLRAAEVATVLDRLTPEQREVVLLRIVGDLSLEEVAIVMGRSVGAIKALQHRATHALRRAISGTSVTPRDERAVS